MAFSVLRSFGSRVFNNISKRSDALKYTRTQDIINEIPILSSYANTTTQITSVRWRTKVPKRKKTGQFPPDLFKVSVFKCDKIGKLYPVIKILVCFFLDKT